MKLLRTLGLALCLAFSFTLLSSKAQTLEPGQVYTTGNIVQDTPYGGPTPWVGGVYQNQLTCWAYGDPGYCGPSPIVRPGGNINFSYGSSYIYQQQHISTLLPSSTGLQVSGYNFGFMAKNGNGWDDGRTDNLMALVRFWDNTNGRSATNLLYGDVYSLNYKFNWTSFDYSKTFTKPLAVPSIGQVQYGFIGNDNNFWQGPYGPEIYNVSFSLKYSVDPCATNVLSSPSCPGYLAALAKLAPAPVAAPLEAAAPPPEVFAAAPPPPGSPPSPGSPPPPGAPLGQESPQQNQPQQNQPPSPAAGPPPQQAAAQPAANNQQPKAGEVADSGGGKSSSPVSLSSVLSMISSNQDKTSALEKSVVQSADAQAFSAGESAKQQAEKVAGDAQSQSVGGGNATASSSVQSSSTQSSFSQVQGSAVSLQGNLQSNTTFNTARLQQSLNSSFTSQTESSILNNVGQQGLQYQSSTSKQEITAAITTPIASYTILPPTRQPMQAVEMPMIEGLKFGFKNPVENAMESKPFVMQMNTESQQLSSVNRNAQNNEAAGNISIESIAKQPANYAQYFVMMPDVAFYAPKEIYKNQKTVDNVRALRQLSSDRLHQEMVNQQYK
jgi:hypothetical protein